MDSTFHRSSWSAQLGLRLGGLGLLALCGVLARLIRQSVASLPLHQATPIELLLALGVVITLWIGLALTCLGARLLRPVPLPPRPLF
jgi:hypothetical protein